MGVVIHAAKSGRLSWKLWKSPLGTYYMMSQDMREANNISPPAPGLPYRISLNINHIAYGSATRHDIIRVRFRPYLSSLVHCDVKRTGITVFALLKFECSPGSSLFFRLPRSRELHSARASRPPPLPRPPAPPALPQLRPPLPPLPPPCPPPPCRPSPPPPPLPLL